jgi:hypothetical protein
MIGMWLTGQLGLGKIVTAKEESSSPLIAQAMKSDAPFPELKPKTFLKTITGRIMDAPETREVNARDGPVAITNFKLTDGAIQIRVGLWAELGDEMNNFNIGDYVTLSNMSVKEPYDGTAQITSTKNTKISRG